MDTREYLGRIKLTQTEKPSYAFLEKLLLSHIITVPFENLDIRQGKEIVLEESHLYEKVVVRRRGGFCYELNGLFCWLLRNLGFTVSMASGRVFIPAENSFTPEFDHMVLLVHLENTYLVDVGFGDAFRKPMAMPEGLVEDVSGKYRVQPLHTVQDAYLVQKEEKDGWRPLYRFATQERQMSDFTDMCVYHQTSPDSHFTQQTVCTLATEKGRVTLTDNALITTLGDQKEKGFVASKAIFREMLLEHFGIELK